MEDNYINKGPLITEAFRYIQEIFKQSRSLINKVENQLAEDWTSVYGSTITKDLSRSLYNPEHWLIEAIYRVYENNHDKNVNKVVTISYWGGGIKRPITQPIITVGRIVYSDLYHRSPWDLWNIWFKWDDMNRSNTYLYDSKVNIFKSDDCKHIKEALVFSLPLISLSNEHELIEKVIDPLKYL